MANTITRLSANGNFTIAGQFDEATFNSNQNSYRKNLAVNSNNFAFGGYNRTVTFNSTTAPDGTQTGVLVKETSDAVNTIHGAGLQLNTFVAGTTYTVSLYAKNYSGDRQIMFGFGQNYVGYTGVNPNYAYGIFNLVTGTASVQLSSGGNPSVAISNIGSGWYRCSLTFTPTISASGGIDIQLVSPGPATSYIGNGTSGIYLWGAQAEAGRIATIYEATGANAIPSANTAYKLDTTGNYYTAGPIDEVSFNPNQNGYRKNLLSYSISPNITTGATSPYYNWAGTFANTSVTSTTLTADPVGTYTAYKFVEGLSVLPQYVFWQQNILTVNNNLNNTATTKVGLPYTYSIYAKAAEYNYIIFTMYDDKSYGATFNLTTGAVFGTPTAGITSYGSSYVGNGWWRIWTTKTCVNPIGIGQVFFNFNPAGNQQYAGDGVSGGYFWGPQFEQGTSPSVYQPTGLNGIPTSNSIMKTESSGNTYNTGTYDENSGFLQVTDNLTLYLDAAYSDSYPGSGTTWYDLSPKKFNGILTNSPIHNSFYSSFIFGPGGTDSDVYPAVSAVINFPAQVTGQTIGLYQSSFTVGAWFYNNIDSTPLAPSRGGGIFSINGSSTAGGQYAIFCRWGSVFVDWYGAGSANAGVPISKNTWYYVTHTYNYTTKLSSFYLNGVLQNVATRSQDLIASIGSTSPQIGYYGFGGSYWAGKISMVHVHNKDLSASEVLSNYNATKNRFNGLP